MAKAAEVKIVKNDELARDDVNRALEGALTGAELTAKQKREKEQREEEERIETAIAANMAKLDKVANAKPTDFEAPENDFWKPTTAGEAIQGIFVGTAKVNRFKQHVLLCPPKEKGGKPVPMRMLGTHKLTRELAKYTPGDCLRIVFKGASKVDSGKFHDFDVMLLKS